MKFLITRSEPTASPLANALRKLGVETLSVPVMAIEPLPLIGEGRTHLLNLDTFDVVVVISVNAAESLSEYIDQYWPQLPIGIQWVAIGKATADALANCIPEIDFKEIKVPDGTDSEALLKLDEFQNIMSKKVLLAKGQGGRDLIRDTLTARGAKVSELPLYQRLPAISNSAALAKAFSSSLDFVQVASGDSFLHMLAMLDDPTKQQLLGSQIPRWFVPSQRVAQLMEEFGVNKDRLVLCEGASNDAILNRIEGFL